MKTQRQKTHNIHYRSLSWLGTGTSIKRGGVKLVLWTKTINSILLSVESFDLDSVCTRILESLISFFITTFHFETTKQSSTRMFCLNIIVECM